MVRPGNSYRELDLLSMEVSQQDESLYRIRTGKRVKYVVIESGMYDYATVMTYPPALLQALYPLPEGDWTTMTISHGTASERIQTLDHEPLPAVESIWHANLVDILSLQETGSIGARVRIVSYEGRSVIAKIARFDWEIQYIENETYVYHELEGKNIAPAFLGHLIEEGRVMGMLLEKVEGRRAGIEDLDICETLIKKVHAAGFIHNDANRYNVIVNGRDAQLVDFENSVDYEADLASQELSSLPAQLVEDTGRGTSEILPMESIDMQDENEEEHCNSNV